MDVIFESPALINDFDPMESFERVVICIASILDESTESFPGGSGAMLPLDKLVGMAVRLKFKSPPYDFDWVALPAPVDEMET